MGEPFNRPPIPTVRQKRPAGLEQWLTLAGFDLYPVFDPELACALHGDISREYAAIPFDDLYAVRFGRVGVGVGEPVGRDDPHISQLE